MHGVKTTAAVLFIGLACATFGSAAKETAAKDNAPPPPTRAASTTADSRPDSIRQTIADLQKQQAALAKAEQHLEGELAALPAKTDAGGVQPSPPKPGITQADLDAQLLNLDKAARDREQAIGRKAPERFSTLMDWIPIAVSVLAAGLTLFVSDRIAKQGRIEAREIAQNATEAMKAAAAVERTNAFIREYGSTYAWKKAQFRAALAEIPPEADPADHSLDYNELNIIIELGNWFDFLGDAAIKKTLDDPTIKDSGLRDRAFEFWTEVERAPVPELNEPRREWNNLRTFVGVAP